MYPLIQQLNPKLEYALFCQYLERMQKQGYFILAAFMEDKLIGFTGCWLGTRFYCGNYLEIDNFVVDEIYRGQGIGDIILKNALEKAKTLGCKAITLNAYMWNEAAHRFYR